MAAPIRVTTILHNIDRSVQFEHLTEAHNGLVAYSFILLQSKRGYLSEYLADHHIPFTEIYYHTKKDLPHALWSTIKAMIRYKPQIVHSHLFISGLIGSVAAWLLGIKHRIYTRHHSDYHWVYYPKIAKYDKFINYLNKKIIAISPIVSDILVHKENVPLEKVITIPHGFQLQHWQETDSIRLEAMKAKYNPNGLSPVIGVVSRWTKWKGIQYILPAFKQLLTIYPNSLLILANAKGEYNIDNLLAEIPPQNYVKIEFESDMPHLFKMMDIFIHVPTSSTAEAFGQVYIEACAAGLPSIFTRSGIAPHFVKDEFNALVVNYCDEMAIYNAMSRLLNDKKLSENISRNAFQSVQPYNFQNFSEKILGLYQSLVKHDG